MKLFLVHILVRAVACLSVNEREAAARAGIPDAVRRPGTRVRVHRRRPGRGYGPRGDSYIGSLHLLTRPVTPVS